MGKEVKVQFGSGVFWYCSKMFYRRIPVTIKTFQKGNIVTLLQKLYVVPVLFHNYARDMFSFGRMTSAVATNLQRSFLSAFGKKCICNNPEFRLQLSHNRWIRGTTKLIDSKWLTIGTKHTILLKPFIPFFGGWGGWSWSFSMGLFNLLKLITNEIKI